MTDAFVIPASALTLWLAALYVENKFRFERPEPLTGAVAERAPTWKRILFNHNTTIRVGGLFLFWFGLNLLVVFERYGPGIGRWITAAVSLVGLALYIFGLSWDMFVKRTDRGWP